MSDGAPDGRRDELNPIINIEGISKEFQLGDITVAALRGVDLQIFPGNFVSIMGPSGSGKSTLMNILGCLDTPTAGSYRLDGDDVAKMSERRLARVRSQKIGFVFQSFNLLARTSALANVELPLIYNGVSRRQRREKARQALELVDLGDRMDHKPNELSGGQQQRVAIARALVNDPSMILADEPTGNLDTETGTDIMNLFAELNERERITLVLVTHDPEVSEYTRRTIHLRDGLVEDITNSAGYKAMANRAAIPADAAAVPEAIPAA
ncbi:MAG: ABC transporter ATP-binding protein [Caldilineaceae bacterium]|nr:ABC transporter ATP-binding protein [Caldilineaceae bacterium]